MTNVQCRMQKTSAAPKTGNGVKPQVGPENARPTTQRTILDSSSKLRVEPFPFPPCRLAQVLGSATRACRRLRTRAPLTFTSVTSAAAFRVN